MSQKYFDESGDLGDLLDGSNTNNFTISIYDEKSEAETALLEEKIRKTLGLEKRAVLKWYKLNKFQRANFRTIFENLLQDKVYTIYWNKKERNNASGNYFELMFTNLVTQFKLFGNYKYEGIHLQRVLEKIRKDTKSKGKKVYFKNSDTAENFGIQICDLVAGYIRSQRDAGLSINYRSVIKFKG